MEQNKKTRQRKITLNAVGLIVLVVLAAANFYVWRANTAGEAQIAELNSKIGATRQQIDQIAEPADDLAARLEEVKAELAATRLDFPSTVDRNEVIDYILDVAGACKVQILPLVSNGWMSQNIGQSYNVLIINATAEGSLKAVEAFLNSLQSGEYPTLTIPECTITRTSIEEISAGENRIYVNVNMRIGIYTCSTAPEEGSVS